MGLHVMKPVSDKVLPITAINVLEFQRIGMYMHRVLGTPALAIDHGIDVERKIVVHIQIQIRILDLWPLTTHGKYCTVLIQIDQAIIV